VLTARHRISFSGDALRRRATRIVNQGRDREGVSARVGESEMLPSDADADAVARGILRLQLHLPLKMSVHDQTSTTSQKQKRRPNVASSQ
jgi:hypothetical protein